MRGKTLAWGMAAAVSALTMTLGGCTSRGAEADEARSSASSESAGAAAPAGDTSAVRPVTVPSEQLERLHVEPVTQTSFRPTIQVTGTAQFNADVSTQVIPPISGPVMRILEDVGSEVHRGQALALVSSPDFATTIADFRKAQAAFAQAKRVADQDEQLWKNDAIAKRDLEQAQTDAAAAAADRDAALQQLRALGVDEASIAALRDGKDIPELQGAIRAPIEGTVVERLINPGQLLQAGSTAAFTVANLATMWVQANVFESDLASVQIGDRADVTTTASPSPFVGKVTYVAALVDRQRRRRLSASWCRTRVDSSRRTCMSRLRSTDRVSAPGCSFLSRRCCATTTTCRSSSCRPGLAATRSGAGRSRSAPASETATRSRRASNPATGSSPRARCSCSSRRRIEPATQSSRWRSTA